MKKTMTCPKCEGKDIKTVADKNTLRMRGLFSGITNLSAVLPEVYICRSCGYSEEYFSPYAIGKLK